MGDGKEPQTLPLRPQKSSLSHHHPPVQPLRPCRSNHQSPAPSGWGMQSSETWPGQGEMSRSIWEPGPRTEHSTPGTPGRTPSSYLFHVLPPLPTARQEETEAQGAGTT